MTIRAFRGVGRANNANNVGNANNADGLASSKTSITTSSKPCRKAEHQVKVSRLSRVIRTEDETMQTHEEDRM